MITHSLLNKTKTVTGFNRFSKFSLLGNNIDGFVNIRHEEFENWEDFTNRFPEIYRNIRFDGEWSLIIYQVPDDYKIKYQYGYFKVPNKGKMIADIGYMEIVGDHMDVFISNAIIHFQSRSLDSTENWDNDFDAVINIDYESAIESDKDFVDSEIYEQYLTIFLREKLDGKTFNDSEYPGDSGFIHQEIYSQLSY